jgi:ankyrin repeat protein
LDRLHIPSKNNTTLSRRLFQWVAFAYRPLTLAELCVAISIEDGDLDVDPVNMITDPLDVLKLGGCFLVCDNESSRVSFAHHTVRDFLTTRNAVPNAYYLAELDSHAELALTCLRYLEFNSVIKGIKNLQHGILGQGQWHEHGLSFINYAAKFWMLHTRDGASKSDEMLSPQVYSFLFGDDGGFMAWQKIYEPPIKSEGPTNVARFQRGLILGQHSTEKASDHAARFTSSEKYPTETSRFCGTFSAPAVSYRIEAPRSCGALSVPATSGAFELFGARNTMSSAPLIRDRGHQENLGVSNGLFTSAHKPLFPLHYLARLHLPNCLRWALALGVSPDEFGGPLNSTPLHEAAKFGGVYVSAILLDAGANINSVDLLERTPLLYATQIGRVDLVNLLLARDARPNSADWYKSSPLHVATRNGHVDIVKSLLEHGAKVDLKDAAGDTPISIACRSNHQTIVAILLAYGAWPTLVTVQNCLDCGYEAIIQLIVRYESAKQSISSYEPLLHTFCKKAHYGDLKSLGLLLNCGYSIDLENSCRKTALLTACEEWNLEAADFLLARGANSSTKFENLTCLHLLARYHKYRTFSVSDIAMLELITRLVDSGCPLEMRNEEGRTALFDAVAFGNFGVATVLLSVGADWHSRDVHGYGLVDCFCLNSHYLYLQDNGEELAITFLTKLVSLRGSLGIVNAKGQTFLHVISEHHSAERILDVLRWILDNGADSSLSDSEGKTPLHCLLSNARLCKKTITSTKFIDVLAQYIRSSVNINSCAGSHGTPLHLIVRLFFEMDCSEIWSRALHLLLDGGADVTEADRAGRTPAALAMRLLEAKNFRRQPIEFLELIDKLTFPGMENFLPNDDNTIRRLLLCYPHEHTRIAHRLARIKLNGRQASTALGNMTNARAMEEVLLVAGVDPSAQDSMSNTPLRYHLYLPFSSSTVVERYRDNDSEASYNDHLRLTRVRVLLKYGADPNIQDGIGDTALHSACRQERTSFLTYREYFRSDEFIPLIRLLRDHGAKTDIKNQYGLCPIEILEMSDFKKRVRPEIENLLRVTN